jgi:hypothetical protein
VKGEKPGFREAYLGNKSVETLVKAKEEEAKV